MASFSDEVAVWWEAELGGLPHAPLDAVAARLADYAMRHGASAPAQPAARVLDYALSCPSGEITAADVRVFAQRFGPLRVALTKAAGSIFEPDGSPVVAPWFHGTLARASAMDLMRERPTGAFLIRFSESKPTHFSLTYMHGNGRVRNSLLTNAGEAGFALAENSDAVFGTLGEFVAANSARLVKPVPSELSARSIARSAETAESPPALLPSADDDVGAYADAISLFGEPVAPPRRPAASAALQRLFDAARSAGRDDALPLLDQIIAARDPELDLEHRCLVARALRCRADLLGGVRDYEDCACLARELLAEVDDPARRDAEETPAECRALCVELARRCAQQLAETHLARAAEGANDADALALDHLAEVASLSDPTPAARAAVAAEIASRVRHHRQHALLEHLDPRRAQALLDAGVAAFGERRFADAEVAFGDALRAAQLSGASSVEAQALGNLATIRKSQARQLLGNADGGGHRRLIEAVSLYQRCLELMRATHARDEQTEMKMLNLLGMCSLNAGLLRTARRFTLELLQISQKREFAFVEELQARLADIDQKLAASGAGSSGVR